MTLDEAVERLKEKGFEAKPVSAGVQEGILGGTGVNDVDDKIQLLDSPFMIYSEGENWIATIPGPASFQTVLKESRGLDEVVEAICNFYSVRNTTAPDTIMANEALSELEKAGLIATPPQGSDNRIWCHVKGNEGSDPKAADQVVIFTHADIWVAVLIEPECPPTLISYDRSLGTTVEAVCDFCRGRSL